MSTTERDWTAAFRTGFYWIGMVMTLACLTFVLASNTELLFRFEHTAFPLSWAFAGLAVVAFLAAESCQPAESLTSETEDESSQLVPEWEAVEV